jgi:hypothetical protein
MGDKDVTSGRMSSRSEALSMVYKVQERCIVRFSHEYNALYTGLVSKVGKKEERYIVPYKRPLLHTTQNGNVDINLIPKKNYINPRWNLV